MEVIGMIYDGDYNPAYRLGSKSQEIEAARKKAFQGYEAFKKHLDNELVEAFEKLMEDQGEAAGLEMREAFIVGARAGAKMLADLLLGG